jgi:bacteriocin-like protein
MATKKETKKAKPKSKPVTKKASGKELSEDQLEQVSGGALNAYTGTTDKFVSVDHKTTLDTTSISISSELEYLKLK